MFYKEHTSNQRPSNKTKHQKGQTRKQLDRGGEKGDIRRPVKRGNKRRSMILLFLFNLLDLE